jgi:hypothetical protein
MDNKSKLILGLILLIILLLALGVFFLSYKIATIENLTKNIAEVQKVQPKVINGTDGKDGNHGANGVDGLNGRDGSDSLSTHRIETFYTPIAGPQGIQGEKGQDGATQQVRLNPETKNLESKSSNEKFWNIIIPCAELLKDCPVLPDTTVGEQWNG